MEIVGTVALVLLGVLVVALVAVLVIRGLDRLEVTAARRRQLAERYRAEAELQRQTQDTIRRMFQTARLDTGRAEPMHRSQQPPPSAEIIEGEAWDE